MRVLLAGGTGLIGTAVRNECAQRGWETKVLTRGQVTPELGWTWSPETGHLDPAAIEWADAVVNLAGTPISRIPWTRSRRNAILGSRIDATKTIVAAINASASPPDVLINGSAVGYYGDRPTERLSEASAPGMGFLSQVTQSWEAAAGVAQGSVRVVYARTGLVLSTAGGVLPLIVGSTRWFAGTRFGSGRELWPWISLQDEARAIIHLIANDAISGPVNLAAPADNTSGDIVKAVAERVHRPITLIAPRFAVVLLLGQAGRELLFSDQRVAPQVLVESGFVFEDATLASALSGI